jgi:hypothetical protein
MRIAKFVPVLCLVFIFLAFGTAQSQTSAASVMNDPLEPVTGPAKVLDNPADRTLVLGLLEQARQNNALHESGIQPFAIKLSFTASGQSRYEGSGEMEETFIAFGKGRWTAHLGSYSQLRIFAGPAAYDQVDTAIPLRIAMVRTAVFGPMPGNWSHSLIRFAGARWNGKEVTCALLSRFGDRSDTIGRRWTESEFCIDPHSGLLQMASEAPGVYATYDYQDAPTFHGRTLPREITIVEAGHTVVHIHVDSLQDTAPGDSKLFAPSQQMLALGPRATLTQVRFPDVATVSEGHSGVIGPIIVHAMIGDDGKVEEAEPLQTNDPTLSRAALDHVLRATYPPMNSGGGPSAREAYINVRLTAVAQASF